MKKKSILTAISIIFPLVLQASPIHFPANPELAKNKKIIFVIGDHEYKSETSMPMMAHILAEQHGFDCTALFTVDPNGKINPNHDNIPGIELLKEADLMVIYTRFRCLPDEQMKYIVDYLETGKPIIGVRTATHAFNYKANPTSKYAKYSYDYKGEDYVGGFGKQALGETWISHWGHHGKQGTRGRFAPNAANHPILKGIEDGEIFGPTDVYTASEPLPEGYDVILLGEVTVDLTPDSLALASKPSKHKNDRKNSPMMPISWISERPTGEKGRVFTTTIGGALKGVDDFDNEGMRRMFVNATYWTLGLETDIPAKATVTPIFSPNPFKRGVTPEEALKQGQAQLAK